MCTCDGDFLYAGMELSPGDTYYYYYCYNLKKMILIQLPTFISILHISLRVYVNTNNENVHSIYFSLFTQKETYSVLPLFCLQLAFFTWQCVTTCRGFLLFSGGTLLRYNLHTGTLYLSPSYSPYLPYSQP